MPRIKANGLNLEYETFGSRNDPAILLIMGFSAQMTMWPEALCTGLADRGYQVIRFDNRDIGLSDKLDHLGEVNVMEAFMKAASGQPVAAPYTLDDFAADSVGVLDALGVGKAHIVGASMGGMIAQHLAARHPQRIATLSLLATSSGRLGLPPPRLPVLRVMATRPRERVSEEAAVEYIQRLFAVIGSPGWPTGIDARRERARAAVRRAATGCSADRQLAAILMDRRLHLLPQLRCPTLVLHGRDDAMVPLAHGRDLARRIPGATLRILDGWGHDLPDALMPTLAGHLAAHARGQSSASRIDDGR